MGCHWWAFYYQVPPNGAKGMSDEALTYATQYGMFHWGPIAWAIYVLPALPIGYLVFVKKQPIYKISQACRPVLKGQTDKFLGKLVDILFIFGLLGGAATSLALGVPMISAGIEKLTGIDGEYGCAFNHLINNHSGVRSQFLFWFEKGIQN